MPRGSPSPSFRTRSRRQFGQGPNPSKRRNAAVVTRNDGRPRPPNRASSGNGALIVPFGLGPAMIAATWSALALNARGAAHWRAWSLMAGTVGIVIVLMSAMVLVLLGSAGQAASNWLSILPLLWMLLAPTL